MPTRGFSLVEVVVATLLLAVGILALTGTSGAVARMDGAGRHASGSATLAASRLERLRAAPCLSAAVGGSAVVGRYREQWESTPAGPERTLRVIVSYDDGRRPRADTYETRATCIE
jgi:prepilin-type N-terminal cleavage/methylation domain-containing protein